MFTLTWDPPFDTAAANFPRAQKPAYLCRLAVNPAVLDGGSMVGARCVRRAVELASRSGADALRSEANPDLTAVRSMLDLFGFEEHGHAQSEDGRRQVYLQKLL
jgi:hypothetical protein